jgi:DNA-binding NtrC family response regulator
MAISTGLEVETETAAETILVVEDDPLVRGFTREILELEGYLVLEACGCAEALLIAEQPGRRIDLIISDVVMPHGDGRELMERMRQLRPETVRLYMSGHPQSDIVRSGGPALAGAFLQKPFSVDTLVREVRAVLDGAEVQVSGR